MPGRPARHVSRITMRISSFHFPPTPWHTPLLFLCAAAVFAAAQSVLAGRRGGTAGAFHAVLAYCFVSTFFAASALRIRGSTDSACGRCAWLRLSTCAIFLSRLIRLIQGLVCCVRYPKKYIRRAVVWPSGGCCYGMKIWRWMEVSHLLSGTADSQPESRLRRTARPEQA